MNTAEILLPMAALALLTFGVLGFIPFRRFRAAYARQVTDQDFKYGESARVPPEVSIPNRNLMNLLEMPVLFYAACLTIYVMQATDALYVGLAWGFVALRAAHSVVHLTYNKVFHRLICFALSNVVLGFLWLRLFLGISART